MPDDLKNVVKVTNEQPETLKFRFTPVDPPAAGRDENPHAKKTTFLPDVVSGLQEQFGTDIHDVTLYAAEHTVRVAAARLLDVCRYLKSTFGFTYLVDLHGNDRDTDEDRFEVVYNLVSIEGMKRLRLKIRLDEENPAAPSLTPIYRAAAWHERECWDMLGIRFDGHPDLRRMFMPEDFEYHPLRKEFPLLGIPGSLPLPPQTPEGGLTLDPFPAARGSRPVSSFDEPETNGRPA